MRDLCKFAADVWTIDGPPVRVFGIPLPTRMIAIKLADGALWINSPVSLPDDTLEEVRSLGLVKWLVAPTRLHVWRLEEWHALFPDAELWMPPQVPKKLLLQGFSGDFLLTRMKVKAAKVKQDVGLEPLPISVAVGFFDESLNPVV